MNGRSGMEGAAAGGLREALGLREKELVAVVGGGGKTSLMLALAGELQASGARVVVSTTTKVWQKEARLLPESVTAGGEGWEAALVQGLERHGAVFLGKGLLPSGKVDGIAPEEADALIRRPEVDCLIVEADGAAGRPLKAPADHEPVIPGGASLVVAVMGLEALGKPFSDEWVFRAERFAALTGMQASEIITAPRLARVFLAGAGLFKGSPPGARRVVFLNKLDLLGSEAEALALCRAILEGSGGGIERVVMGAVKQKTFNVFIGKKDDQHLRQG
ncbi:selenium cofactor biosynthesis protein YqeC [Desulfatiglans anilini]|uniref:selenium cofactor biosynthesis protein YqeC n=1 Tax=Desulfatiglans anilini TaxID=90728 RepID=UPI0004033DFD|nr:selenium cofactor biosynthesis protein YqeC [Desulfatiglans anilini]